MRPRGNPLVWCRNVIHERTLLVLVMVGLVAVSIVLWETARVTTAIQDDAALQEARHVAQAIDTFRTAYTKEVVERVRTHGIEVTHDYQSKEGAIPLPATLSMQLAGMLSEEAGQRHVRLYSDFPFPWRTDGGPRSDFERDALSALRNHPEEPYYRFGLLDGQPVLQYAIADRMRPSCVSCHNTHPQTPKSDWKVGDVRGVLAVTQPVSGGSGVQRQLGGMLLIIILLSFGTMLPLLLLVRRSQRAVSALENASAEEADRMRAEANAADHDVGKAGSHAVLIAGTVTALAIFGFDISMPLGLAAGVPYVLVVLMSMWSRRQDAPMIAAIASTILIVLGFVLSSGGGVLWMVLGNRLLALFAIWVTAILCSWQKRRAAEESKREAERKAALNENIALSHALHELRTQKLALDAHAIVSVTDLQGNITLANSKFCEISGYSQEELIGQNHRIVKSEEHSPEFFRDMWLTISQGKVWRGEVKNRRKDGTFYWVDATIFPFKDENGKVTQYVALRSDITERKAAERSAAAYAADLQRQKEEAEARNAELQELNAELEEAKAQAVAATRAKSEFLANMSHEIRTPMAAILGYSETLLEPGQSEEQRTECVETIHRNGEFLLSIINDLLDLSKIEASRMTVESISFSPCKIIAEVASLMRVRVEGKGLSLKIDYDGAIPETIQGDPTRLRQILINLIGNAVKFTEEGSVQLLTRFVSDGAAPVLQFDVIDSGVGMTEEQISKLFQPFTQADSSTTRKFGGTGLGLTISKRFAELLGGDIAVVESRPGVGTCFRATVTTGPLDGVKMLDQPTEAMAAAQQSSRAKAKAPASRLDGCRILLAEDGKDNRRLFVHILKKAGAEVRCVENGKLAAEAALAAMDQGDPFDVILMDMQMPVMDGYGATRLLRREGYGGPIIALTAHAMASDRRKCIDAGCDDFATKPIDRNKLIATVREHWRLVPVSATR